MMLVGPVEDQRFHAPVSGAKQLKHSGPIGKRTMISHTGAYSRWVNGLGWWRLDRNMLHNPATFNFAP